jgi:hypothetical protein
MYREVETKHEIGTSSSETGTRRKTTKEGKARHAVVTRGRMGNY